MITATTTFILSAERDALTRRKAHPEVTTEPPRRSRKALPLSVRSFLRRVRLSVPSSSVSAAVVDPASTGSSCR